MSIPIMTMEENNNVLSAQSWLTLLKNFLQSQGWTVVRHLENVQWQVTNGFIAGTEFFLEVTSNGFGNQSIHIRMRVFDSTFSNSKRITMNLGYGDTTLDTASSIHPVSRFFNPNTTSFGGNIGGNAVDDIISSLAMPKVYLFGYQQKYCCIASVLDTLRVNFIEFGTLDLEDFNSAFGEFTQNSPNSYSDWLASDRRPPFDKNTITSFNRDDLQSSNTSNLLFGMHNNSATPHISRLVGNSFEGAGESFGLVVQNVDSDFRLFTRNKLYYKDSADNLWYLFARDWAYRLNVTGRKIAERFTVGTEEYISFPNYNVDLSKVGVAFRLS